MRTTNQPVSWLNAIVLFLACLKSFIVTECSARNVCPLLAGNFTMTNYSVAYDNGA